MSTLQQQNAFVQAPTQGDVDLRNGSGQTIAAEIDASSAGSLVPGQAVKVVDSVGGVPKVVECAANSDDVYGFINFNLKDRLYNAYDKVELSAMRNNVMYMTAAEAISRGGKVMIVVTGSKVANRAGGGICIGRAFDKAVNVGDLIRVTIDLPGVAS